jgi:O-antigen ligase
MKKIILGSVIVTLAATPWVNSDALIIPKIIVLTCLALYILPELSLNLKNKLDNKMMIIIITLSLLFILQMVIVMLVSEAPFEQEFFGRTGRGLGFLTYFSLILIFLYTVLKIKLLDISKIFQGILISCFLSSGYSIFQYFGLDFSDWRSLTNGIIGTIGNPNFQSSFVAISFIPTIVYLWGIKYKYLLLGLVGSVLLFTLYICESTQGYIAIGASLALFTLIFLWYQKSRSIFVLTSFSVLVLTITALAGMLNKGPFAYYLYKVSVRSRGEMWQTANSMIRDNFLFGVGLDSVGDYSLKYRSAKTANGIDEYIDNFHNFFLQFAATGGVILAILYLFMLVVTLYCFYKVQRRRGTFDKNLAALAAAWLSFQLQSFISPAAIPTLIWNFVISGAFIGLAINNDVEGIENDTRIKNKKIISSTVTSSLFSYGLMVVAFVVTLPLFNADKLAREADSKKDALLAVKAAKMYPESVVRYNRLGAGLYESKLYDLSLDIGRSAIKFNPDSYLTWILILVNPNATYEERLTAKEKLIEIDPYNKVIRDYKF